jgi:hypothetical protein
MDEPKAMMGKRKTPQDSKTQIRSLLRVLPVLGLAFLPAGCISARQIQKTRNDAAMYGEQQRARAVREHCIDNGAIPGTTAYLECQLKAGK